MFSAKKNLPLLVVLFFVFFLILIAKVNKADALLYTDCVNDYGGACQAADCSSDKTPVEGTLGIDFTGDEIGCPDSQRCCVPKCQDSGSRPGWKCFDRTYCGKPSPNYIYDCDGNDSEVCCQQDKCTATSSSEGHNCASSLDTSVSEKEGDDYNTACSKWFGSTYNCYKKSSSSSSSTSSSSSSGTTGSGSGTGTTTSHAYNYANYLSNNSFTDLIKYFFSQIQTLVGYLAVIFMVIGGIVYIISAGNSKMTSRGKEIVTMAIAGFALAIAVPSILKGMVDLFTSSSSSGSSSLDNATSLKTVISNVLNFLLTGVGMLAIIGFVIGGFFYLSAAGDSGRADTGRKTITYSIIAVCLAGAGVLIVRQVLKLLAGTV